MSRFIAALILACIIHTGWTIEDCTCYFGFVTECPKDQSCNRGWNEPVEENKRCRRMKPDIGKETGTGGKHNNPKNCVEMHKNGRALTAPCDGLCGDIKKYGSFIKNVKELHYAMNRLSHYYKSFRTAAIQPGLTKFNPSNFVKLNDISNNIDYYAAYHVMGLVNGFWGDAVIHDPEGTHKVEDHPINHVSSILIHVSDEAVAIITDQLGTQINGLSSIDRAIQRFQKFVKNKQKDLIANKVDITFVSDYFNRYASVLLMELGLEQKSLVSTSKSKSKSILKSISKLVSRAIPKSRKKSRSKLTAKRSRLRMFKFGSRVVDENEYRYQYDTVDNGSLIITPVPWPFVVSSLLCMVIGFCFGGVLGAVSGIVAKKWTL